MKGDQKSFIDRLFALSQIQDGYFTSEQATKCGYINKNFSYYVKAGRWISVVRGIYRLKNFPESENEQYTLWSLWVGLKNEQPVGVYSHLTALSYYGLSEVVPSRLYITVPLQYKTTRKIPKILILNKSDLSKSSINYMGSYAMTTVKKTLIDLADSHMMDLDHFAKAIIMAYNKGHIDANFIYNTPEFHKVLRIISKTIN